MRRIVLVVALALTALGPGSNIGVASDGGLTHEGRWLTDAHGRAVVLHGVNMVAKKHPYDPAILGFGEDDAAFLAAEGFNTVRLGVIYAAVEPTRGSYDEDYLDSIERTVDILGAHGIHVMLDFHQDLFNERFQGEGFPAWAVRDDGIPAIPPAGFPGNYFVMPALWRAFEHLYANTDGVQDSLAAAWAHVAARFKDHPAVFGYDLLNEPWPGSDWLTCVNPVGCPLADARFSAMFQKIIDAVRAVDPDTIVYYETHPVFGAGTDVYLEIDAENAGFSFHQYCLGALNPPPVLPPDLACPLGIDRPFERAEAQAERLGDTLLLSEFGATDTLPYIRATVEAADRHMMSWQYWAYWNEDPAAQTPEAGMLHDISKPPTADNVKQDKLDVLARPYPRAVAGQPFGWGVIEPGLFAFQFTADGSIDAPTEIVVPARAFPGGYEVAVDGPAAVTSAPDAPVLTLDATDTGTVLVTVFART